MCHITWCFDHEKLDRLATVRDRWTLQDGVCFRGQQQCLKSQQIKNNKITQYNNINKHVCHLSDSVQTRMISGARRTQ